MPPLEWTPSRTVHGRTKTDMRKPLSARQSITFRASSSRHLLPLVLLALASPVHLPCAEASHTEEQTFPVRQGKTLLASDLACFRQREDRVYTTTWLLVAEVDLHRCASAAVRNSKGANRNQSRNTQSFIMLLHSQSQGTQQSKISCRSIDRPLATTERWSTFQPN